MAEINNAFNFLLFEMPSHSIIFYIFCNINKMRGFIFFNVHHIYTSLNFTQQHNMYNIIWCCATRWAIWMQFNHFINMCNGFIIVLEAVKHFSRKSNRLTSSPPSPLPPTPKVDVHIWVHDKAFGSDDILLTFTENASKTASSMHLFNNAAGAVTCID